MRKRLQKKKKKVFYFIPLTVLSSCFLHFSQLLHIEYWILAIDASPILVPRLQHTINKYLVSDQFFLLALKPFYLLTGKEAVSSFS